MTEDLVLSRITERDLDALLNLIRSVGWNYQPEQLAAFISAGNLYGHRSGEALVSSAGMFLYGAELASIGIVIVDEAFRRRGLASSLVHRCLLDAAPSGAAVSLIATPAGFPVYRALGFETVDHVHRWVRQDPASSEVPASAIQSGLSVLPMDNGDLADVLTLDAQVMGADRRALLQLLYPNRTRGFVARNQRHEIDGFGIGFQRGGMLIIGPLLARTSASAENLVASFISSWEGPVRIDTPSAQSRFMQVLSQFGFMESIRSAMMVHQAKRLPGHRSDLYGILDPALG